MKKKYAVSSIPDGHCKSAISWSTFVSGDMTSADSKCKVACDRSDIPEASNKMSSNT